MENLTAAVVGTGFIGPVHVEALTRAGVHVIGILGSTPEKSRKAASQLRLPRGYDSLDQVLADDSVDVVHLATPNHLHHAQSLAVLNAGKHVMCEKPLAMNSRESSELVRKADESGLACGVAYNVRYYPLCHEAAARVQSGNIGDVLHITGSYVQDWLLYETDFNWRVLAEDGGELRAVADIGTHWLDLAQFVTGQRIVSVCADLHTVHQERRRPTGPLVTYAGKASVPRASEPIAINTEDYGCVMLRFANNARGSLHVSQTTAGRKNCIRFELAGSKEALAWNSEQPNLLWIGHRDHANESLIRDPALMHDSARGISTYPGGHNEGFSDTFKQLFRTYYGYIGAGDSSAPAPFPTFADGHHEILLCEAILASHRKRCWIDVAEAAS